MIQFSSVYKSYSRDEYALENLSVKIPKGDFFFITGHSGAGKTTFLKLITREERPTKGAIIVGGRNISIVPERQIYELRRNIGIIFQDFRLLEDRTVFDNVALALKIRGVPPRQIRKEVTEVLRWVGLPQKIGSLTRRLSGGEQQRVAIARAIVTNPSILLADEPTGNLDQEISLEIMEMFRRLNSRGTTILVASHNQMLLERYARNVLYLKKGTSISLRRVAQ
ncbi:MAG: Cell division ATP-binding protein FtsE [Candidatus Aminicenantes bacterium ADurb.Bin508]|nr:MAG: Cell division ATP-binding protein FtsE [Candidatus Aminicenantes bacterium ADurb.Bin508]HNX41918.1 cell division ATP-binding protein FtsE [Candidatus Aminicenantes bacterium]HPB54925.1 cell division ATP-binding protein FtsE [Candidatus Aminicenantes bacterium]HPT00137.1 cell division ATP-binding protein FtsE [Candidatus Aminicenantes bacterium]